MKNIVIAILLLVSFRSSAQKLYSTHYFDFNYREVKTLEAATFIREIFYPEIEGGNYKLIEKFRNEELDAEALRVIKLSPKWTPAMKKGKPVRSFYSIPISFQLK